MYDLEETNKAGLSTVRFRKYFSMLIPDEINMMKKLSSETISPKKQIGDDLNYNLVYNYDENYAHRLKNVGNRYYKYDSNGNIICEKDGSFEEETVEYGHLINQESEDVYSTDYGWGLNKEADAADKKTSYQRNYTWNEKNQLISSVDSRYSTSYVYGQDGQRSNKYTDSSETVYFNKMWTLHSDNGNSRYGGQYAKNIYLGDTRIVTKLNSGDSPSYQEEYYKQYFYHSDHLGSASLISDYKGDEYQRIEYTPYGETWVEKTSNTGTEYLPYKFTGKEIDEETGLYYYGARYLDPKYSLWISTDPALGEYVPAAGKATAKDSGSLPGMGGFFNHINFNLYHYAGNNPVKYTDPDGRKLYVCGSKQYMAAVQRELSNLCSGAILNFDTGEVTLSPHAKTLNPNGYDLLSSLIDSPKTNTIWLGNSRMRDENGNINGNSAYPYDTRLILTNGKFDADYNIVNNNYGPMNSVINFDPDSWQGGEDDNGSTIRPPFIGLSHESGHSEAINNGTQTYERYQYILGTTPNREKNSLKRENEIRAENKLTPRSYYIQPIRGEE